MVGHTGPGTGARLARLVVLDRDPLLTEARALIAEQTAAGQRESALDLRRCCIYPLPI